MKYLLIAMLALSACRATPTSLLRESVVKIVVLDDTGAQVSSGTVWAMNSQHLMTADHICRYLDKDGYQLAITTDPYRAFYLEPIHRDKRRDICILKGNPGLTPIRRGPKPREGERLQVVGYPLGLELTVTEGFAGPLVNTAIGAFRQLGISAYGGNSGGPVLNAKGEVVCMLVAGIPQYPQISFCTEIQ